MFNFDIIRVLLLLIIVVLAYTLLTAPNRAHGLASDGKTHMPEITSPLPIPPPPLTPLQEARAVEFKRELDKIQYIHEEFAMFAGSVTWDFYSDPELAGVNERNVTAMVMMLKSKWNWPHRTRTVEIFIDQNDQPYVLIKITLDSLVNPMFEYNLEWEMIPGAPVIDEKGSKINA